MKRIALLATLSCTSLVAFKNIELHKKEIKAVLQKNNPALVPTFDQFCVQYDQSVTAFFDTNNNLSLAHHIQRMEKDLAALEETYTDIRFASVQALLMDLNTQLQDLVTLLKQYRSSKNALALALKVRQFKKLLPAPINTWSEVSLFLGLNHRLNC